MTPRHGTAGDGRQEAEARERNKANGEGTGGAGDRIAAGSCDAGVRSGQ